MNDAEFNQLIEESMKRQSSVRDNKNQARGRHRHFYDIQSQPDCWYLGLFQFKEDNE